MSNRGLLFHDIWFLQAIALLAILGLQPQSQAKSNNAEHGEDEHGQGVVVLDNLVAIANYGANDTIVAQHIADEQGHATQTDVLYPEDERIGRTQKAQGDNLGH